MLYLVEFSCVGAEKKWGTEMVVNAAQAIHIVVA